MGNKIILWIWCSLLGCVQHHLSSPPLRTWLNGFWFTIMLHFSVITWTISSLWAHRLPMCHNNLQTCVRLCKKLGLPLHPDKLEGPATCLTILGIELNSEKLQACLPTDKKDRIVSLLDEWSAKRFCKHRKLESLIGHLHHACKVAPQGRTFLRRMINLLCAFRRDITPLGITRNFGGI